MKSIHINLFILSLCFILFLIMLPSAFAEEETYQVYDESVISGFESGSLDETIAMDYKKALIELEKKFPSQLNVFFGGKVLYQETEDGSRVIIKVENYTVRTVDIIWKCMENYDEELDVFHFVPDLREYKLAAGLELPVITVNILGNPQIPPLINIVGPTLPTVPSRENVLTEKQVFPSYFNSYEDGLLPDLRNQNPYGTCWAFAAIAAVEGDLIHDGNADTSIDLSELHLAYYTNHDFYDEKQCNTGDTVTLNGENYLNAGGDNILSLTSLANMLGPVEEAVVPYDLAPDYDPGLFDGRTGSYQITGAYILNPSDLSKISAIKNEILNHYMVSTRIFVDYSVYSATYNSYYKPTASGSNHVVALVGWDDNFPRDRFIAGIPEGNGAWLVRNSWARENEYSISGYFWVSYYDPNITVGISYDVQTWRYDHVYSYDNLPYGSWYSVSPEVTVSQNFHVDGVEQVKAVGYYNEIPDLDLLIRVSSEGETVTESFATTFPGYYLIPLSSPLTIRRNADVSVEFSFLNSSDYEDFILIPAESDTIEWMAPTIFTSYTASDGMVIDQFWTGDELIENYNTGHDSKIKLFTDSIKPDLVLPEELKIIGNEAFAGGAFTYVKLPEKTVSIGWHAFADCNNLAFIYIPEAATNIDSEAFWDISSLTIIGVSGSTAENYASEHGFSFVPVSL